MFNMDSWWIVAIGTTVLSFLNILTPISGVFTVTPLIALVMDIRAAIGFTTVYLLVAGIPRIYLFRKSIRWDLVKQLIVVSTVSAALGAFAIVYIDPKILLVLILVLSIRFLYERIRRKTNENKTHHTGKWMGAFIGVISGFMQGAGLSGSELRNNYLYAQGVQLQELHGTTAIIGFTNFFIATIIRLNTSQLSVSDLSPLLILIPATFVGIWVGRKAIQKLDKKHENALIIITMFVAIVLLAFRIAQPN